MGIELRSRSRRNGEGDEPDRRSMRGPELRCLSTRIELRQAEDDEGPGTLVWYPAVYEQLSEPLLGFREKVARGAFDKTVREHDIRALINHDDNYVLGRSRPRVPTSTLSLFPDDDFGLRAENPLPDTEAARALAVSIQRGDVDQGSFGFTTIRDEWDYDADLPDHEDDLMFGAGGVLRTLLEVKLWDVSVVTFPAYPQTTADVRSRAADVARAHRGSPEHRKRLARLALTGFEHTG